MQLHLATENAPSDSAPFYVEEFPNERLAKADAPFDGITFRVVASTPSQTRNDGTVQRKPFIFDSQSSVAGYTDTTMMWWETLTVEFTIWSKSSASRSVLINWFHRFLMRYANVNQFFEARGADKFTHVGRGEDGFETREQQLVYFGTQTYQFRIQFLDAYTKRQLDNVTVNTSLAARPTQQSA